MTMVYGILYQNSNYQLARLNDFLNRADALNRQMRVLIGIYQGFMVMQSSLAPGNDHLAAVDYRALQAFLEAGIAPPQSSVMVGLIPSLYFAGKKAEPFFIWDFDGALCEIFYKNGESLITSGEIRAKDNFAAYLDTAEGRAAMLEIFAAQAQANDNYRITDPQAVLAYADEMGKAKTYNLRTKFCAILWKLRPAMDGDGGIAWNPEKVGDLSASTFFSAEKDFDIEGGYAPILEDVGDVIAGQKPFFLTQQDLGNYCDVIRLSNETLSNRLSTVTTMLGNLNGDIQQNFTTATNILAKMEDAKKKTAANTRI
jgi:hypothetical protein